GWVGVRRAALRAHAARRPRRGTRLRQGDADQLRASPVGCGGDGRAGAAPGSGPAATRRPRRRPRTCQPLASGSAGVRPWRLHQVVCRPARFVGKALSHHSRGTVPEPAPHPDTGALRLRAEAVSIDLSVLVPCFNEEGNLPELVDRTERVFDRRGIAGEIVLVNDGSHDGTGTQIDELATTHSRVVAVHHPENRGMVAAWKTALEHSHGACVLTIDADLQYQPEAIGQLWREMRFSNADVVQGWRSPLERQRYDLRYYTSRGLDVLLRLVFDMHETDIKSGFCIYKREVFADILQHAPRYRYFQTFVTVAAKAKGYSVRQFETLFLPRKAGTSFISRLPLGVLASTMIDIGRAVGEFRVRRPKEQALALALAGRPS